MKFECRYLTLIVLRIGKVEKTLEKVKFIT